MRVFFGGGWEGGEESQKDLLAVSVFGPDAYLLEVTAYRDCYQSEMEEGNKQIQTEKTLNLKISSSHSVKVQRENKQGCGLQSNKPRENKKMACREEARKLLEDARRHHSQMPRQSTAPGVMITRYSRGGQVGSKPRVLKYVYGPACGWEEASVKLGSNGAAFTLCIIMSCHIQCYHVLLCFSDGFLPWTTNSLGAGQCTLHSYILSP